MYLKNNRIKFNNKKINKLGCIIFARLASKRLKNKALLEINNVPLILIIYKRVLKIFPKKKIVVATSNNKSDDKLVKFCKKNKINFFRGDLRNVHKRAVECCIKFKFSSFLRVCADRPYIHYKLAKKMKTEFNTGKFDIVTNTFPKTFPKGLTCEIIDLNAFSKINSKKFKDTDREHILNYFYRNFKDYKIKNFCSRLDKKFYNMNLAIDNKKDFLRTKLIFNQKKFNPLITAKEAILLTRNLN